MDLNFRMNIYIYIYIYRHNNNNALVPKICGRVWILLARFGHNLEVCFQVNTLSLCKLLVFCIEFLYNTFLGLKKYPLSKSFVFL